MECLACEQLFDPIRERWRCPVCRLKHHCCEGAPLAPRPAPTAQAGS